MRVAVDPDRCETNGICARLVPQVFELGDRDIVQIALPDVPAQLGEKVRRAVWACPKIALLLDEAD